MLSVDQAQELVAAEVARLAPVRVPLRDALGLVLAIDVVSDIDSPPYDKSMMDGYAVIASDRTPERKIVERIMAGDVPRVAIQPGSVAQVMTGAPVPLGTTAVVPVERTEELPGDVVRLDWNDPPNGKHILQRGSSMRQGHCVARTGSFITPQRVAVMAEAGAADVPVVPRPTVAVLSTGNELVDASQRPAPGQIRNCNGPMLLAAAAQFGAVPRELPCGADEMEQLTSRIREGLASDILLVTGGVSAGVKDLVPEALAAAGVEQVFHKISLKPGKPLWFGVVNREPEPPRLVFGLPGNPVSGLVCFHLFVRPAFDVLAGRSEQYRLPWRHGTLAESIKSPAGRETLRPACIDSEGQIELCPWIGSADLAGMADANCLLRLPCEGVQLSPGDSAMVLPL